MDSALRLVNMSKQELFQFKLKNYLQSKRKEGESSPVKTRLAISCRNPFKMDEIHIRYDQDSDEELADLEGEKISEENPDSDQESQC